MFKLYTTESKLQRLEKVTKKENYPKEAIHALKRKKKKLLSNIPRLSYQPKNCDGP